MIFEPGAVGSAADFVPAGVVAHAWRQRRSGGLWFGRALTSAALPVLDRRAPNGFPFALPFSEFRWKAISKNRVKPAAAARDSACAL